MLAKVPRIVTSQERAIGGLLLIRQAKAQVLGRVK
jgi:hypothetical protein